MPQGERMKTWFVVPVVSGVSHALVGVAASDEALASAAVRVAGHTPSGAHVYQIAAYGLRFCDVVLP